MTIVVNKIILLLLLFHLSAISISFQHHYCFFSPSPLISFLFFFFLTRPILTVNSPPSFLLPPCSSLPSNHPFFPPLPSSLSFVSHRRESDLLPLLPPLPPTSPSSPISSLRHNVSHKYPASCIGHALFICSLISFPLPRLSKGQFQLCSTAKSARSMNMHRGM